jgi:hypothetical protein
MSGQFRILVTGSRNWGDEGAVYRALSVAVSECPEGSDPVIVHGACPTGADAMASRYARDYGFNDEPHPASWGAPCRADCKPGHRWHRTTSRNYCPAAGNYRNQEMVDASARMVFAFFQPGAANKGTSDLVRRAVRADIQVALYGEVPTAISKLITPADSIMGNTYGSMVVTGQSPERGSDGSVLWVLACRVCGETILRSTGDIRRERTNCQGLCRSEIARLSPVKHLYADYRRNAAKLGREFALTIEEFHGLLLNNCHYCGISPAAFRKKPGMRQGLAYNGIDRVDNKVGYVSDNCVTACRFCNMAKGQLGADEFISWLDRIRSAGQQAHCADLAEKAGIPVRRFTSPPARKESG